MIQTVLFAPDRKTLAVAAVHIVLYDVTGARPRKRMEVEGPDRGVCGNTPRTGAEHQLSVAAGIAQALDAHAIDREERALTRRFDNCQREIAGQERRQPRAKTCPARCGGGAQRARGGREGEEPAPA